MAGDVEGSLAQACADLARMMAGPDTADDVLPGIADHAAAILGVGSAAVVVGHPDGRLGLAAGHDLVAALVDREQELAQGPTVDALARGVVTRAHTLVDVGSAWPEWVREARARDVGAWLAVPTSCGDSSVVLSAASTRAHRWTDDEVTAARVLADVAAGWLAHTRELAQVRRTAEQLQQALDRRVVIEQAKGILAGELGCTLDEAFDLLRGHARRNNITVRALAHAVVNLGLRPPDGRPHEPVASP
jgi:GAF domain-containing protein